MINLCLYQFSSYMYPIKFKRLLNYKQIINSKTERFGIFRKVQCSRINLAYAVLWITPVSHDLI